MMNAARLSSSARLRRALTALEAMPELTTLELIRAANICAVNAVVAELRENGCEIECEQRTDTDGRRRWVYRLIRAPKGWKHG